MKKIARNFIYSFAGNIGTKLISFLIVAFITRTYGSEAFGNYNVANAEYSYFSMFAIMGMDGYGLYLLSKDSSVEKKFNTINDVVIVKSISGIIATLAIFIYAFLIPGSHMFIWPYFLALLLQEINVAWVFNALQDMKSTAFQSFVTVISYGLLVMLFYYTGLISLYALIYSSVISIILSYLYIFIKLKYKYGYTIKIKKVHYFEYICKSFPYMASGFFAGINTNIDLIVMGYVLPAAQIGFYSADYKLINEFVALCAVIFTPFFPVFVEHISNNDINYINKITGYLRTILMGIIIPCTIYGICYGKQILALLFGQEYSAGYGAFAVLMVFVSILYYREIYGYILAAAGKQKYYLRVVAISAVFNLITNIIFIPKFGITAGACTTLCSEIINYIGMKRYVDSFVEMKMKSYNFKKLIGPLILLISMSAFFLYMNLNVWLSIAISAVCYVIYLVKNGVIRKNMTKEIG